MLGAWLSALALAAWAASRTDTGADQLRAIAERTDGLLLGVSLALMTSAIVLLAVRWRVLIPGGERIPLPGLTAVVSAAMLLNTALPGPAGELAACVVLHRRWGIPTLVALAADLQARFIGLAAVGMLATVFWLLFDLPVPPGHRALVGLAALAFGALAVLLGLLSTRPRLLRRVARLAARPLARLGRPGRALGRGAVGAVDRVGEALEALRGRGPRPWLLALGWSFVGHFAVSAGIHLAAVAMGMTPRLAGVLFTYAAATAGTVLLYALPGTQLGWDALLFTFFVATAGLSLPEALALTAVIRLQHLFVLAVGAGALAWLTGRRPPG